MTSSAKQQSTTIEKFARVILSPQSSEEYRTSKILMVYVKRLIAQFNLKQTDVDDILAEAFLRAFKRHQKEPIKSPKALMKNFCYYVVREMSRQRQKCATLADDCLERIPSLDRDNSFLESLDIQTINELQHLRENLSPVNARILDLWSQGLSDREIAEKLSCRKKIMTVASVKKRRQRLINRLKKGVNR